MVHRSRVKNGYVICVTETITRRTINKDLCEEVYYSDGDIGPFFYEVADKEDIKYYTEEVIDPLMEFQGAWFLLWW